MVPLAAVLAAASLLLPTASAARVVALEAHDDGGAFRFSPAEPVVVSAGETISLLLQNRGGAPHGWTLDGASAAVPCCVPPGAVGNATFSIPSRTGDLPFACPIHRAWGMAGTLRIEGPEAGRGLPGPGLLLVLAATGLGARWAARRA